MSKTLPNIMVPSIIEKINLFQTDLTNVAHQNKKSRFYNLCCVVGAGAACIYFPPAVLAIAVVEGVRLRAAFNSLKGCADRAEKQLSELIPASSIFSKSGSNSTLNVVENSFECVRNALRAEKARQLSSSMTGMTGVFAAAGISGLLGIQSPALIQNTPALTCASLGAATVCFLAKKIGDRVARVGDSHAQFIRNHDFRRLPYGPY